MKKHLIDFLTFSRTEQRGIITLVACIFVIEMIWQNLDLLFPESISAKPYLTAEVIQWADSSHTSFSGNDASGKFPKNNLSKKLKPFPFNPNTLPEVGWIKLGFSEKEAKSVIKFRNKGGRFHKPEDLRKLYCVTEERFQQLSGFIQLEPFTQSSVTKKTHQTINPSVVELNSADSLQLIRVKGIGPYRASKIIRWRNRLGGFWSFNQLLEIKGFNDSLLLQLKPYLTIDTNQVKKISVNRVNLEELQSHPYFWYGVGKSIVNFRDKHGPFHQPSDLKSIYALKPEQLEKIVHYLKFE